MKRSIAATVALWLIFFRVALADYEYIANTDTVASVQMFKYGSSHIDDLKALCDSLGNQCAGFDTAGYLVSDATKTVQSSTTGLFVKIPGAPTGPTPRVWPWPQSINYGNSKINFQASDVQFTTSSSSQILQRGIERYKRLIFAADGSYAESSTEYSKDSSEPFAPFAVKQKAKNMRINRESTDDSDVEVGRITVSISVQNTSEALNTETDESYTLSVASNSIQLNGVTVYGALRGLETLSQLIIYNFEQASYEISFAPISIKDFPKFPYRGLLIDTSRHYLPVSTLKMLIDSMSYSKLNVLHWHIVDAQSFPLEIKSFPLLWKGAWSVRERYSQKIVNELVDYARDRGVRVIPEFDGPGHAFAWGVGYPQILPDGYLEADGCASTCPVNPCDVPLDPSNPFTFQVLDGILSEVSGNAPDQGLFPDEFIHLGGDEVELECWNQSQRIQNFLKELNSTDLNDVYKYYIFKAHEKAIKHGRSPINWEEVFNNFGTEVDKRVIFHIWLDSATLKKVVEAGYRGILSDAYYLYLDHWDMVWTSYYADDPLENITDPAAQKLVLGAEACMWGERMDPSDLFHLVWPKAAALAEQIWSYDIAKIPNAFARAAPRLNNFRCLLNDRGIGAAPVFGDYPNQPGSCFDQ
jgi:hexosaminidase